jgi:teichuronic acid biosynthesis glycosyltransferase TuaC
MFVHDQVKALRDTGVAVKVVSPTGYAPRAVWAVDPRLRRRGQKPRSAVIDGVDVEYPRVVLPPRRRLFEHAGGLLYAGMRGRLEAWHIERFDLVHAHQAMPDGAAARRLSAALGVPYLVTVHGVDVNVHLGLGGAIAATTASVLNEAAAVVAVSTAVERRLAGVVAPQRLHVVGNGVDARRVEAPAGILPGRRLILSVGHLIESKGNSVVLEALARLAQTGRFPDLAYAIVGAGVLRNELRGRARELGLGERVQFLGHLPHREVLALMARADVFVLPSSPEGFGIVYAEAMAQATPVVACRGEGPADFIDDGVHGLLVPPRDPLALAAALERLLGDVDLARRIGEAGRLNVAQLTWQRSAAALKEIYDDVVARAARRGEALRATPPSGRHEA